MESPAITKTRVDPIPTPQKRLISFAPPTFIDEFHFIPSHNVVVKTSICSSIPSSISSKGREGEEQEGAEIIFIQFLPLFLNHLTHPRADPMPESFVLRYTNTIHYRIDLLHVEGSEKLRALYQAKGERGYEYPIWPVQVKITVIRCED